MNKVSDLSPRSPVDGSLEEKLRERFGLEAFRPWQREAIESLLYGSGRALVIAPTGGGKSLCYQFPATELPGTTVVVSPLIALMEDQVRGLRERGIEATFLASTLNPEERRERGRRLMRGEYQLVYVAPERLAFEGTVGALASLRPPLVAIDEAHCISQWGHDFRPDYLRLGEVLAKLGAPRVLACTATATPIVRDEILERLSLRPGPEVPEEERARVFLRGFARPNLHLIAHEIDGNSTRRAILNRALKEALGSPRRPAGGAIVYAATRKKSETAAEWIAALGYRAAAYHAGLEPDVRAEVSRRFAAGELDAVAATNAFGMGIDRPDIRCVIHTQAPGSIEAYYQEVGRAGRDGKAAVGVLMSSTSDIGLRRRLIELSKDGAPVPEGEIKRQWGLFLDLLRYVEAGSCRHDFILRYFDDEEELLGGCGHCDVCERLEGRSESGEREVGKEEALLVKKALSGVARGRQRAGLNAVAEMLQGAKSPKLERFGFHRLSTFGLLKDRKKAWVIALLRRLITAGLVDLTTGQYPMPYLTHLGVRTMKGEEPVRVLPPPAEVGAAGRREKASRARIPADEVPASMDPALFEALREARLRLAKEKGVPAYVVCHDRTLMAIAADRPRDKSALSEIRGMGPARIEAYGEPLLEVVRAGA